MVPAHGNQVLRTPFNRYLFNVRASFADEVAHIVDHLATVGIDRIAVFHPNHVPGRAALASAMESMHSHDLGGYTVSYSPTDHSGSKYVDITVIGKDGKILR